MKEPLISIVIPVYNSEKYLEKCLESVCNQTYRNIEIVCVNDGSTDSSPDILKKYSEKDNRIVVIDQENSGVSRSRNVGVENSKGEWISFVDSDDYVSDEMCSSFVTAYKNSEKFDIYMFNGVILPEAKNPNDENLRKFFYDSNWIQKPNKLYCFKDCRNPFYGNLSVWNKIYRKEFLEGNNIVFKENITFEDQLYTVEAMVKAKLIYIDNKILYYYVQHGNSIMHSLKDNSLDIFEIMSDVRNLLVEHGLYEYEKYVFLQHKFNVYNYLFLITENSLKNTFYYKARENLVEELKNGFNVDIINKITRNNILFDYLKLSPEEYYKKYS